MRFKKAIMIPVFIYTKEEIELSKLDLTDESNGFEETEEQAFWCVDSAFPDDRNHQTLTLTGFYSNGQSFYSPIEFKEFVKLINNHK